MKQADIAQQLQEIKTMLQKHERLLEELRDHPVSKPRKHHWRALLLMAAIVLVLGSFASLQYYRILQSIIDQYPHAGVSRVR